MPDETAAQYGASDRCREHRLEPRSRRTEREPARAEHLEHELLVALVDPRRAQVDACLRRAQLRASCGTWSSHCDHRSLWPRTVAEVRLLDRERHRPDADLVVVDGAQRRHLGGSAAHEDLVREVEIGADQSLLRRRCNRGPRAICVTVSRVIPGRMPGRQIGRVDDAVADDEDVLAGAVGDGSLGREQDRLVVAGVVRLGHREQRVDVDAGGLRDVRDDVRRDALPGRDLGADAGLLGSLAEIRRPRPAHDHGLDRVATRRDAELAVAVERDRPDVALGEPVRADHLVAGGPQLVDRVRDLHVEQARRVVQPLDVVAEPEDRGALGRVVAANAFEDAGPVMQAVDADVNLGVGPVDELAVHPDLLGLLHHRLLSDGSTKTSCGLRCPREPRPRGARGRSVGAPPCERGCRPRPRPRRAGAARVRAASA